MSKLLSSIEQTRRPFGPMILHSSECSLFTCIFLFNVLQVPDHLLPRRAVGSRRAVERGAAILGRTTPTPFRLLFTSPHFSKSPRQVRDSIDGLLDLGEQNEPFSYHYLPVRPRARPPTRIVSPPFSAPARWSPRIFAFKLRCPSIASQTRCECRRRLVTWPAIGHLQVRCASAKSDYAGFMGKEFFAIESVFWKSP